MNPKRSILILCALILLFGAGSFVLRFAKSSENTDPPPALPTPKNAEMIEIVYAQAHFAILRGADGGWTLREDEAFPLDEALCAALARALTSLTAEQVLSGGDGDPFGFDHPLCRICALDADGTQYRYTIGSYNDYNRLYYLSCGGEDVYMLDDDAAEAFFLDPYDLIKRDIPPDIDADRVQSLSVQTASGVWQYTLRRGTDADAYEVSGSLLDPGAPQRRHAADAVLAQALFKSAALLYLFDCVEYRAFDAQTLAAYGLSEPAAQVTLTYTHTDRDGACEERTFGYEFGDQTEDGYIYVRMAGSGMVFLAYYREAAQFLSPDFSTLVKSGSEKTE